MGFLNKMERKFGKYAIQNLTFWLIGAWVLGFIIQITMPDVLQLLLLEPRMILQGQVWRIVSWLLIPPPVNILFLIFFLSCYYFIGISIEQAIGTFRYNVYLIGGILCSILGAFFLYGFYYLAKGVSVAGIGYYFSTQYITMSLFLAFAVIFPNIESGNAFYKSVSLFANADMAGLLQGPICPVVLPSRSDSGLSKYYSIAMACLQVAGCECREKLNLNR